MSAAPSPPRLRLSLWLALIALLAALAVSCLLWLKLLPQALPIREVRVEGRFVHLEAEKLRSLSAEMARGGFFNVNVGIIRERLLAEPWVAAVAVKRRWPDTLVLSVQEQTPVGVWNNEGLLNERGEIFARRESAADALPLLPELPLLSGPEGAHRELLRLLLRLQRELQAHGLRVTGLRRDARRSISFILSDGTGVRLGNKDIRLRTNRFLRHVASHLYSTRAASGARSRYVIDMRYTNGFAVGADAAARGGR